MDPLTIDQAAAETGVSKHTLRYYEREGLLPQIDKAPSGHRRYSPGDIEWVRFLQLLRATGMPIREMKTFVALTHAGDHTIPDRIAVLERYHAALVTRMAEDREHLARLDRKLGIYRDIVATREVTPEHIIGEPSRT
ncbi:MerR family transcriptional regulator [Microbacterium sp. NPDC019599]|uniref:MerR family transcriptional regulator n=1 Tax=Microbacterium sp. NPDC019599 TaxID=3154690 RepID=UPI0033FFDBCC